MVVESLWISRTAMPSTKPWRANIVLVVDTNILIYSADRDSRFHDPCRRWLERQQSRPEAWYTTWPILYEFVRVATHPRVLRQPWKAAAAWKFVMTLLASPGLSVLVPTEQHANIAAQVIKEFPELAGNIVHHAHIAILMREHGIRRICTRDMDFHRFPFLELVDPARG
jgi:toxin-antitoxin system PIN domain toxin